MSTTTELPTSVDSVELGTASSPDLADKEGLSGILRGYPLDQLVDELITAWDELANRNQEVSEIKRRVRVLELDLADRIDEGAPEAAKYQRVEEESRQKEAKIIHLERVIEDLRAEKGVLQDSLSAHKIEEINAENQRLRDTVTEQEEMISEMEIRLDQLTEALEAAADSGLSGLTAEQVRFLEAGLEDSQNQNEELRLEGEVLSEERDKLRELVDRLRSMVDQRDEKTKELQTQLDEIRLGPRSISAEHDYLVEQIEELKRRLMDRNREHEALRRRERRLHREVFDRDERIQQMQVTLADLESALQDRMAELRSLENEHGQTQENLESLQKSERTRKMVDKVYSESMDVYRSFQEAEDRRKDTPIIQDDELDEPITPGGTSPPAVFDDDDQEDDDQED